MLTNRQAGGILPLSIIADGGRELQKKKNCGNLTCIAETSRESSIRNLVKQKVDMLTGQEDSSSQTPRVLTQ